MSLLHCFNRASGHTSDLPSMEEATRLLHGVEELLRTAELDLSLKATGLHHIPDVINAAKGEGLGAHTSLRYR